MNDIYRITPSAGAEHSYYVKAVSVADALLTLTELDIFVYESRGITYGANPTGNHLIVSAANRKAATKALQGPPELDPDDERFKGTQAHAILAGSMFMPGNEEEIPVIRTLLAAAYQEEENARAERDRSKGDLEKVQMRLDRAGNFILRTQAYLNLTITDLAKKEAKTAAKD